MVVKVTNDIKTIIFKFYSKSDSKRIELLLFKATELLSNQASTDRTELASKVTV